MNFAPAPSEDRQAPVLGSSNGKTSRFGREDEGSTPSPRAMTGFFALLTPEQQAAALAYTGDDNVGPPVGSAEWRRFKRRSS